MSLTTLDTDFLEIIEDMFNRWTALKLAVEHGMGGPNGLEVSFSIIRINKLN